MTRQQQCRYKALRRVTDLIAKYCQRMTPAQLDMAMDAWGALAKKGCIAHMSDTVQTALRRQT
jgi:hypothetical protein